MEIDIKKIINKEKTMFDSSLFSDDMYKLLEEITKRKYKTDLKLLQSLVDLLVDTKKFKINGARIWELAPEQNCYKMRYQNGSIRNIPKGYEQSISKVYVHSQMMKLIQTKVIHTNENDELLQELGIKDYALTAAGEIVRLGSGKYFEFLLSFSSDEFSDEFFKTLSIISTFTTVALRNQRAQNEKSLISKDIRKASEIQRNLLPQHYLEYYDYKIFGLCIPDQGVGGDYFDYIKNSYEHDQETLAIVISDAASKGLPAAIQALFVSGAIRMGMAFATRISHIFALLNNLIYKTFPQERFVSLFYCELTASSNRLVLYANAGHCEPIHYRPSMDRMKKLGATGSLLGVVENQKFGLENIRMMPGDILLLYTDGINEAQDDEGNLYGEEKLQNLLRKHCKDTPKNIAYYIIEDVQKFSARSIYSDDKTLVVIKRDEFSKYI